MNDTVLYKGISFFRFQYDKSIIMTNVDLVKRDLLNHIFTRRGDRVKMPNFGTTIPDKLFEQLDQSLLLEIELDLEAVFNYDPRVELISLELTPIYDKHTLYAVAELRYIELDMTDRLELNLEFGG